MQTFPPDDAQRLFEQLTPVAAAKGGRDFVYKITRPDGSSVTGQVVERTSEHLGLLIEDPPHNRSENVAWDDILEIRITVEP